MIVTPRKYAVQGGNVTYPEGPVIKVWKPHPYGDGFLLDVFGVEGQNRDTATWKHHGTFNISNRSPHFLNAIHEDQAKELGIGHGKPIKHAWRAAAAAGPQATPQEASTQDLNELRGAEDVTPDMLVGGERKPRVRVMGVTSNKPSPPVKTPKMLPPHNLEKDLPDDEATRVFWSRRSRARRYARARN